MNNEEKNRQENEDFNSEEKGLMDRNKGKKGLNGDFLGKITGKIIQKAFVAVLIKLAIVFLIMILISMSFDFIDKTVDRVTIGKTPEKMQEILKFDTDELQKLVTIKGSDEDGYYLGYVDDFDEKIEKLAKETRKTAGLRRTTEEMLEKIIRAELITQYPKLGEKKTLEEVKEIQARIKERGENEEDGRNQDNSGGGENGELEDTEAQETETSTTTENTDTSGTQGNSTPSNLTSLDGFLFIGDSITELLGQEGGMTDNITFRGVSWSSPNDWLNDKTCRGGPTYSTLPEDSDAITGIHIMLGNNGIEQIGAMQQLLEKLHNKYPGRTIFVSKLLPIPGVDTSGYVGALENFCNSNDYLKMIDATAGVQMISGDEHPTAAGCATWGQNIRNAILQAGGGPVSSSSSGSSSSHGTPYTDQKGIQIDNSYLSKYDGFQGTIRIRRVMPNKNIGASGGSVGRGVVSNTDTSYTSGSIKDLDEYLTGGQWGVYAKNLKTGKIEVNKNGNASLKSASVIKLFIAAAAYANGYANDGTVRIMINNSDNDAANEIMTTVGMDKINNYIQSNGYSGTQLKRKMLHAATNGDNMTSAEDVGNLLEKIYNKEIPGAEKILQYMNEQTHRAKIPAGLPAGVQCGNKTGELNNENGNGNVQNDAAIVYKDDAPYILVVLSNEASNAVSNIVKISSAVYNGITGNESVETEDASDDDSKDNSDSDDSTGENDKTDSESSDEDKLSDGSESSSRKKHVIAVDPGHGTKGPFASSYEDLALSEQDLSNGRGAYTSGEGGEYAANKRVADLVAEKMKSQHPEIEVIQTGDEPNFRRLKIAKEKGAEAYIGIHHDASLGHNYMGMIRDGGDSKSMSFATTIVKQLGSSTVTSGGHTESGLRSYSQIGIPNMYTESKGRNPEEYAQGIVDGIVEYFGGNPAEVSEGTEDSTDSEDTVDSGDNGGSGEEAETSTQTASQISSKVFDMRFVSMKKFNELVEDNSEEALKVYTLDEGRNLITAKWSYSSSGGIKISTNPPVNFKSIMRKYITTFEYLYDYYAHLSEDDQYVEKFMNDFLENIYKSEFIIAVQDNVTTTESGSTRTETVTDTIELTYADTWFIRAQKDVNYATATVQTTTAGGTGQTVSGGNNYTAEQGALIGNFRTTAFCYECNYPAYSDATASGRKPVPNLSIATHIDDFHGNGPLSNGSFVIMGGQVFRVDDCGGGAPGNWIDIWIEWDGQPGGGDACDTSSFPSNQWDIPVYVAENVRESGGEESTDTADAGDNKDTEDNKDETKTETTLITGTLNAKGEVKSTTSTSGGTRTTTTTVKYDTGEDYHVTMKEKQFREMFEKNPKIWASLEPEWLIELIEENATQMLDITKYYLNKLANEEIFPDVDEIKLKDLFETFADNEFADAGGVLQTTGGTAGSIIGGSIQAKVWVALRKLGYSEEATAGAMGNIHYESGGFNPSAIERGSGIGAGLCQWSYGRRTQLEAYARSKGKDWKDEDIQVEFLVGELTQGGGADGYASYQLMSTARATPSQFINAKSVQDATRAFCWSFERPRADAGESSMPRRIEAALKYYDEFAGRPLTSIVTTGGRGNGDIIASCEEVAAKWRARGVHYSLTNLPSTVESALNSHPGGCCATYVSTVLYNAGLLTAEQVQSYNMHWTGSGGVPDMLRAAGWTLVTDGSRQPGDVINNFTVHVCIYAGPGMIWDQRAGVVSSSGAPPIGGPYASQYASNPSYQCWRAPGK